MPQFQATPFLRNNKDKSKIEAFLFSAADFNIPLSDPSLGVLVATFELPAGDPRFARLTRLMAETVFLRYYENLSPDREMAFENALQELNRRLPDLYLNFGRSWLTDLTTAFLVLTEETCYFYHLGTPLSALWVTERRVMNIGHKLAKDDSTRLHPLKIFSQYHRAPLEGLQTFCLGSPLLADLVSSERLGTILREKTGTGAVNHLQKFFTEVPNHIPLYGFILTREISSRPASTITHRETVSNARPMRQNTPIKNTWPRRYRWAVLQLHRFSLKQKGLLLASGVALIIFCSTVGVVWGQRWLSARATTEVAQTSMVTSELSAATAARLVKNQGLAATHFLEARRLFEALPKRAQSQDLGKQLTAEQARIFKLENVTPNPLSRASTPPPLLFDTTGVSTWEKFRQNNNLSWNIPPLEPALVHPTVARTKSSQTTLAVLDAPTNRLLIFEKKHGELLHQFLWSEPQSVQNGLFDEQTKTASLLSGTNVYTFSAK